MIRRIGMWRLRRRVRRLTIRLRNIEASPFGKGKDAARSTPRSIVPDAVRYDLELAKLELACLEDWGRSAPAAKARER